MLLFNTDNFTPSDYFTSEETTHNISHDQPNLQETLDSPQTSQKVQQSSEPRKPQKKRNRPTRRKISRPRFSFPDPNSGNEYSKIMLLGFTLIKFFFFFVAGFVIAFVFTSVAHPKSANVLWEIGSILIIPLVVLVFCIIAIVIIAESCR